MLHSEGDDVIHQKYRMLLLRDCSTRADRDALSTARDSA
jgi:hypothetical protein